MKSLNINKKRKLIDKILIYKIISRFFLIFFFLISFNISKSQSINDVKIKEDLEIEKIQEQIKGLEKKIQDLKLLKENKLENKDLKVGLALSGGGAKGYAHLGVLRVLERENIKIDYISGTSIGALIGTLYSIGYSIDEIENILDELNVQTFWESGTNVSDLSIEKKESLKKYSFYVKYDENFNYSLPKGLKDTETMYLKIKKLLNGYKNLNDTSKLPIPVRIVATNLNTGAAEYFEKGDIAKILTASMAIPAILEPVIINDSPYVDGLVSRNLPVQDAYEMGADLVIASDIGTEVTHKNDYNILSILNQMIAIQSSYINRESRDKASVLILPDIKNISALDTSKKKELITLGENAAQENMESLNKFPKRKKTNLIEERTNKEYLINKIEYSEVFNPNMRETLNGIFQSLIGKTISDKDIERKITRTYNLKYVNKLYYTVKNNVLYLDGEVGHLNMVGIGLNYRSGYGTTVNLGTDMYFNGKFGNIVNFNLRFGDYLALDLGTYSYYGRNNKVGVFSRIGYNESPFFHYENGKKTAKFLSREIFFNLGLYNQPNNKTMLSYAISSKILKFDLDTGNVDKEKMSYSGNINKTYFRFKYDTLDSITVPMNGLRVDFIYNFSNSFGGLKTSVYGPSYSVKGYKALNKNFSLLYGLNSAIIRGDNIKADQYIKLGGVYNNIENNEFEFYGFNFQEKSVKEFLSMNLGLRYKLFYSMYLTTKFNIATFGDDSVNARKVQLLKSFSKGLGLSLTYDSPIGPVELTVSDTFKGKSPLATFSIGYKLD